jgi:thiamine transport system substrate-binding protein
MIIMPDPLTTGMGRAFLQFTAARFGAGFGYLWDGIKSNFLTYTESYDEGYRQMMAGEVHIIPAMITQMRYHRQEKVNDLVRGVLLKEGTFRIVENAAVMAASKRQVLAKKFVEYLLESKFQNRIWEKKWMYPANRDVITDLELNDEIAMYESRSKNPGQVRVKNEEADWLKIFKKTLEE